MDEFIFSLDLVKKLASINTIETVEIKIECELWRATNVSFYGNLDSKTIVLDEGDEGTNLEKYIWVSLESMFPFDIYHSPSIKIGNKERELIDVLASYEYGSFLIEAKDRAIFSGAKNQTSERKLKSIQKNAKKALGQLVGASKAIKRGERVFDESGKNIGINVNQPFHCIVLLTELPHEGDWSDVEEKLWSAIVENGDYFHVFDLQELVDLLLASEGVAEKFDYNLIERCKLCFDKKTVHVRSQIGR